MCRQQCAMEAWAGEPAGKELEHENSKRPEVDGEIMAFVEYDLRRHVLRSTAERPRLTTLTDLFRKPEIHLQAHIKWHLGVFD